MFRMEILQDRSGKVPIPPDMAVQAVMFCERVQGRPRSSLANVQNWHTARQRSGSSLRSGGMSAKAFWGMLPSQPIAGLDA